MLTEPPEAEKSPADKLLLCNVASARLAARWATAGDSMSSTWLSRYCAESCVLLRLRYGHRNTGLGPVSLPHVLRVPNGSHQACEREHDNHDAVAAYGTEHGRLEPG